MTTFEGGPHPSGQPTPEHFSVKGYMTGHLMTQTGEHREVINQEQVRTRTFIEADPMLAAMILSLPEIDQLRYDLPETPAVDGVVAEDPCTEDREYIQTVAKMFGEVLGTLPHARQELIQETMAYWRNYRPTHSGFTPERRKLIDDARTPKPKEGLFGSRFAGLAHEYMPRSMARPNYVGRVATRQTEEVTEVDPAPVTESTPTPREDDGYSPGFKEAFAIEAAVVLRRQGRDREADWMLTTSGLSVEEVPRDTGESTSH